MFVGNERKLYNLHESLLCQKCPFFEKCLNGPFEESSAREVNLKEEDPNTFDQFVLWIYDQPLTVEVSQGLARTYIMADKFLMEGFKNAVVDRAKNVSWRDRRPMYGLIELCGNGLSQSAMGKYFWAQLAFHLMSFGFEQ